MQTSQINSTYTDFSDLAKLKTASINNPQKALETVARQFEALFTQMIFKSMRSAELSGGLFDNNQTKMYQDILDKQLSTTLSSQKGLGIADMLIRQLQRNQQSVVSGGVDPASKNNLQVESDLPSAAMIHKNAKIDAGVNFTSPKHFIAELYPIARQIEQKYQIPARSLLAQAALETGWGQHIMHDRNGSSSFNLYGIKAGPDWHGKVVTAKTNEYVSGQMVSKNEPFRAYDSFRQSMLDYVRHISSDPRYQTAYQLRSEPRQYFTHLQLAGYATDPDYASKINKIIDYMGGRGVLAG